MKTTNFTKKGEVEILNAAGEKTGLKQIDDWLANPQTDHKSDWIFRVKIEPFELSLNEKKRKIETIDFFVNADTGLEFYLKNALKDNNNFELKWGEENTKEDIGFSENHPNILVVFSNPLYFDNLDKNQNERNLEINWENITSADEKLIFSLASPISLSLNNHNFTYNKVFWHPVYSQKYNNFIIKRLSEWKADKKPFIIKTILSFDCWLSVKDNGNLYILRHKDQGSQTSFYRECTKEAPFIENNISGWLKLPYHQREKFIKRNLENGEEVEDMKKEIEKTIQELKNDNNNEPENNQKNPVKKNSVPQLFWKIVGGIALFCLILVGFFMWLKKSSKALKN